MTVAEFKNFHLARLSNDQYGRPFFFWFFFVFFFTPISHCIIYIRDGLNPWTWKLSPPDGEYTLEIEFLSSLYLKAGSLVIVKVSLTAVLVGLFLIIVYGFTFRNQVELNSSNCNKRRNQSNMPIRLSKRISLIPF